ncbi:MAG: hypothetical protein GEU75_11735 [Dehalococcoidia bacterium]|nr:hypothetical protein [Dehalococcoidia bacterium]
MITDAFGKLYNDGGELVAEGPCQIDLDRGSVTLRPIVDTALITRQEGNLSLRFDDGVEYTMSARVIRFRLNVAGVPPGPAYRLVFADPADRLRSIGGSA